MNIFKTAFIVIALALVGCGGAPFSTNNSSIPDPGFQCPDDFTQCTLASSAKVSWNEDVAHCVDGVGDVSVNAFCPMPVAQSDCEQLTSEALVLRPSACSAAFLACAQSSTPRYSQGCYVGHYACDNMDGTTERCAVSLGAGQ